MKKSAFYLLFLFFSAINSGVIMAAEKPLVITSLPATSLLVRHLVAGSEIETELVVPAAYSMSAQKSYLKKSKTFAESAQKAAACITIAAAWRGDNLYPFARRHNIHIVAIDAAAPIDRSRSGVVLVTSRKNGEISPYIWRSPANLVRMAEFISNDLQRLFPQDAPVFKKNLQKLQRRLFQLRTHFELRLSEKDMGGTAALTDDFDYLTSEFGIEIGRYFLKEEIDWTVDDCTEFSLWLKNNDIKLVLCKREPQENIAKAIADAGAVPVVLQTLSSMNVTKITPEELFTRLYSYNLLTIIDAVK